MLSCGYTIYLVYIYVSDCWCTRHIFRIEDLEDGYCYTSGFHANTPRASSYVPAEALYSRVEATILAIRTVGSAPLTGDPDNIV